MSGNIVFIILYLIYIVGLVKKNDLGILYFLIFSVLSPALKLGNNAFTFEMVAFIPFILAYVIRGVKKERKIFFFLIYFLIYIVSTIIATVFLQGSIQIIPIIGMIRYVMELYILIGALKRNFSLFEKTISTVMLIELITTIIQFTIPRSTILFYQWYYRESLTPLIEPLERGRFVRGFGTFGTPVIFGVYSLLAFTYFLCKFLKS